MEVREQGECDSAEALGPCFVTELGVDRDTQNLGIGLFELSEESVEAGDFDASGRREVERIEDEEQVFEPLKAGGFDGPIEVAVELEIGGLGSRLDHGNRRAMGCDGRETGSYCRALPTASGVLVVRSKRAHMGLPR
jgi:hypothetical protein